MHSLKSFIIALVVITMIFNSSAQVLAGNQRSKPVQPQPNVNKNYLVYLVGGLTTNRNGLENLKRALKLEFHRQGLHTNIQFIFPYLGMENLYANANLERLLRDRELAAEIILENMELGYRTQIKALEATASTSSAPSIHVDIEPIIIAHGLGAVGAIRAAELLPNQYNCRVKNLVLIGAPKLPIICEEVRARAIYLYNPVDPMTDLGNWFLNDTGINCSPIKHVPVDIFCSISDPTLEISSSQGTTYQHINSNNYYFFENEEFFIDKKGISNIEKTLAGFFNDLYIIKHNSFKPTAKLNKNHKGTSPDKNQNSSALSFMSDPQFVGSLVASLLITGLKIAFFKRSNQ